MSNQSRKAAEQMDRDGIRSLTRWTKPKGPFGLQTPIKLPKCGDPSCDKLAGYMTPRGVRCFGHARP